MTPFRSVIYALAFLALIPIAPAHGEDGSMVGVFDLPSAFPARAIALVYSGDGGWQDLDKTIGEWMAAKDIHVIGVSTVKAFWNARQPAQVAVDIKTLIAKADPSRTLPVMLIGYSFGADILPFAWPELDPETQGRIRLIALLAPGQQTAFHVSVAGWLGIKTGDHSVPAAMKILPPDRVLCVFGEDEANETPCLESTLQGMEIVHTTGGHHFDNDYPKLAQTVLGAFDARALQGTLSRSRGGWLSDNDEPRSFIFGDRTSRELFVGSAIAVLLVLGILLFLARASRDVAPPPPAGREPHHARSRETLRMRRTHRNANSRPAADRQSLL